MLTLSHQWQITKSDFEHVTLHKKWLFIKVVELVKSQHRFWGIYWWELQLDFDSPWHSAAGQKQLPQEFWHQTQFSDFRRTIFSILYLSKIDIYMETLGLSSPIHTYKMCIDLSRQRDPYLANILSTGSHIFLSISPLVSRTSPKTLGNWSQRILHASAAPVRYVSLVCESVRGGGSLSVISSSCNYHGATETHNDDDVPAAAAEEEDSGTFLDWVMVEKKPVNISRKWGSFWDTVVVSCSGSCRPNVVCQLRLWLS